MSDFNLAISFVLKHEGGLSNNLADPGGITNYGVSLRFLKALGNNLPPGVIIDEQPTVDAFDVRNMNIAEARLLYKQDWWDKYQYGNINDQFLANKVFDIAINIGPAEAAKLLQKACSQLGSSLEVDGMLGSQSFTVINKLNASNLLTEFCKNVTFYYQALVKNNPNLSQFLQGWLNRVNDYG
ncbi:MAG TPA: glycosyl hydrolase 108 family protein [Gammaproteobacteria bacterium]|nr:glycosyl hydrolase 108 family protein [Gammaproteobacteria bacterium]